MPAQARLLSLATAVPPYRLRQVEVARLALELFDGKGSEIERLLPVFAHAGIETRYSCVPLDWYLRPHGWAERSRLYVENAVELLTAATETCLARAGAALGEIGCIVMVSTTGIATPSLDALLMERLGLRRDTRRLPVFGLGCGGGVIGLSHAAAMAGAAPGGKVLLLVVELCGLTFRHGDQSNGNIVATALFGDGAAAALIGCDGDGPALGPGGAHTWPRSLDVMGWRVADDGLGVLFSRDIPELVRNELRGVTDSFLAGHDLTLADIDRLVCHPGGAKVLNALEETFGQTRGAMTEARSVLRDYGNMSAATVLFVLERVLRTGAARLGEASGGARAGRLLLSALGPGFTAGFQILEAA
ncbi:MAG: 3-oxoacyl-[acyl-carrier-protein] synthase III C-terminal domain-containing protein [Dongiaceae bacterium]